jgi:DHA1 family bicyclomycin/chloramphenicol resistance-like MFS transporter
MNAPIMSERRTSMIGALLVALGPVTMALYTPAMPELAHAFSTSVASIKLTLSLYFGGFALAQLVAGPMADGLGRRKTTMIFLSIFLIGSLAAVLAPNVWVLLAGRLVQGIGASVGLTVSRAIVRDQFSGPESARIMNMIAIMLTIGPAIAPTIGGLALVALGWQSIFLLMVGLGITAIGVVLLFMAETTVPDPMRIRIGPLVSAYREILGNAQFLSATLTIACSIGILYGLATILPFILIGEVGLTPAEYGLGMLLQTGSFLAGSLVFRKALGRFSARQLVAPGLFVIAVAAMLAPLSVWLVPLSYLSVMAPVGVYAFGVAFIQPHLTTAALAPFPHVAGSASAAIGFSQMGSGMAAGMISAIIGIATLSYQLIVPAMALIAIAGYLWHLRSVRPEPDRPRAEIVPPFVPGHDDAQ